MKTFLAFLALTSACLADQISIRVTDESGPVLNAQVACILKSGAYQDAKLDPQDGQFKCEPTEACVKIYSAAPGFEASCTKYSGAAGVTSVAMKQSATKSSAIIHHSSPLPGIEGSVEPTMDQKQKWYLYSKKIGITVKGKPAPQPVPFEAHKPIDAVTPTGQKFQIWFRDLTPQVSLLEFSTPK